MLRIAAVLAMLVALAVPAVRTVVRRRVVPALGAAEETLGRLVAEAEREGAGDDR